MIEGPICRDGSAVHVAGVSLPGSPATQTIEALPWQELDEDNAAWDALALSASEPNPFFESWYLLPSLRALDRDGSVEIVRFALGGRLSGLIPMVRKARHYRHPLPNRATWMHGNCFLGAPLVARGAEEAFWEALLEHLDRVPGTSLFLHLPAMPLGGRLFEALQAVVRAQSRFAAIVRCEERALLASHLSPEAYFEAAISGKKRKELRRQTKRLREEGDTRFDGRTDSDGIVEWTQDFLSLEASGWKGRAGSAMASHPGTRALFEHALAGAAERGRLERLSLLLDGKPIAMLATFLAAPGAFSYKTAFAEDYARFSPGVLLQRENLAVLANEDIAWSDSCASADHPMIDHIWRERRAIGSVSVAVGGGARQSLFSAIGTVEARRAKGGRVLAR
ncbi:hypothetical protein GCM10011371_07640 [Novosphingobium marinum]|uniref:CelD/BcsL family acetyltransferase involved in cellulose biosynthesis n=1 Tax=Novosphingobium marinum TaxID=1514948 RepID=A0A7Y9XTS0_9SPHN|nr:GNAT family N-acetyltransferase [Novosphingobium marinum]NYH94451.1 CelD/BcsL family acetyltransferase involved in cellulose biosynthesis [Novosphingobium marinum]GGC22430.1 hypothetical protein GCM10011371_07640 [Novosphingobium marinum]